jgi:hypothetical protein
VQCLYHYATPPKSLLDQKYSKQMQRNEKYTLCLIHLFKAIEDNAANYHKCLHVFSATNFRFIVSGGQAASDGLNT